MLEQRIPRRKTLENEHPLQTIRKMSRIRLPYWPLLLLIFWSCRKDVEQFDPYPPSAQDIGNLLLEQVPHSSTHTTFTLSNLSGDEMLETANGTRIYLIDPDHLFAKLASGLPVLISACPDLKIEVTEVFDKSDIIARKLYTVADNDTLFESGGMVSVTATCNGEPLVLMADRTLKIQIPNNNPQSNFIVFNRTPAISTDQRWLRSDQEVFEAEWPIGNTAVHGYELLVKNLGWVACGRMLTDASSSFCMELPVGFGGQNTQAYLIFKNQQVVAPLIFNLGMNKFCYPKAPIGFQVELAAVSRLGKQYWLGKGQTEIGTGATVPLNSQEITEESVINFVKSL